MKKPVSTVEMCLVAEIRRCEHKMERARKHAAATRSPQIRAIDQAAVLGYRRKIENLRRRTNDGQQEHRESQRDREAFRQVGFGLWAR